MKHAALSVSLLVAGAMLAACASGSSSRAGLTITPETKLALGTLKLEGTPQAVDKVTAAKLLPLWQLLQQLSTGTSTAPQEITAVLDEINATMTPAQTQAIEGMQFTQANLQAAFQQARSGDSGGATGGTRPSGTGSSNRGNGGGGGVFLFSGGGGPGGGAPGGGFAGGGGFPGGGTTTNSSGTPTAGSSSGSTQSSVNRSSLFLVSEVVRLLESKIGT
jgi:hypothetical protein